MKTWMKILMWAGAAFGIGFFGGEQIQKKRIGNLVAQVNDLTEANEILNRALDDVTNKKPEDANQDGNLYNKNELYKSLDEYNGNDISEELGQPAPDAPMMVTETPVIGDEDIVEKAPTIEFITEEEFYNNQIGMPQEQLIWYTLDEVLWNKETNTRMSDSEVHKSIGYGTLDIFDHEDTDHVFVRNNLLDPPTMFRIDRIESAWCDEHGDTYDEDI